MDTTSILIGILLTGVFILLFLLPVLSTKKRQKNLYEKLAACADQNSCKITKYEILADSVIGIDEKNACIFYCKKNKEHISEHFLKLADVKSCKALTMNRVVKSKSGDFSLTDKLGINFTFTDKNKPDLLWEFYNAEETPQLNIEIRQVQKWVEIFSAHIRKA